jgi:hypothetical protein
MADHGYTYKPLNRQADSIRLLTIDRAESGEIDCHLHEHSASQCPEYIALSYTWGLPSPVRSIHLDGSRFPVRENLFFALELIRKRISSQASQAQDREPMRSSTNWTYEERNKYMVNPGGWRCFWIDAICTYSDRSSIKHLRNLRCLFPRLRAKLGSGNFTLRVFKVEIYQYIAFYPHPVMPPSPRLARSSC